MVFPDCPCQPFIGEGQRRVPVINDQHPVKVSFGFYETGLDGIAQPVLGGLVDDVERLQRFHIGQGLSVGTGCRQPHGKVGLALAGIALDNGQLPKRDIGEPKPFHACQLHICHTEHGNRLNFRRFPHGDNLGYEFAVCYLGFLP